MIGARLGILRIATPVRFGPVPPPFGNSGVILWQVMQFAWKTAAPGSCAVAPPPPAAGVEAAPGMILAFGVPRFGGVGTALIGVPSSPVRMWPTSFQSPQP